MLTLIQIARYLKNIKGSVNDFLEEITWIVDNHESTLFELSERQIESVINIYNQEKKFEGLLKNFDLL